MNINQITHIRSNFDFEINFKNGKIGMSHGFEDFVDMI